MLSDYYPWLLASLIVYLAVKSIYRLYFHPLSKFPGPKLTAITHLYEFYHDIIRNGMFIWEIEKMHEKYGPIVRINPREIHINDPSYYDEIYASSSRIREKDPKFVSSFMADTSMVSTISHGHHRFRRALLNNFFSKKSILDLAPLVQSKVDKLMDRLEEAYKDKSIVELDAAFAGLTADVITQYCYGRSWDYLSHKDYNSTVRNTVNDITAWFHINRFFPFLPRLLEIAPLWLACKFQPGRPNLAQMQTNMHATLSAHEEKSHAKSSQQTIFDRLTDPDVPAEEKTATRLKDESLILLSAGTETTSRALTVMSFYLSRDPAMRSRLRDELKQVMPTPTSPVTWPELERLPYLTGVVNESLRLSYGVIIRLPRVAPTEALQYQNYTIPPGTPMSTISYFVHRNPTVFPDPEAFNPDRWIEAAEKGEHLSRFIVSFTRGSRMCLGLNLAYFELYTTIAAFVRRFDVDLHNTELEDIRIVKDLGVGYTKHGPMNVSGRIVGLVE
ncbi:hypothetical protein ASPWEDRAFT_107650 [Aspergillus wentii DTO 134E9]|uniref:Cytochrome P450 n=1 Tax=Aspergillus wentii DTO 134E9 TaxID=1073089 RepID=A0A1L9RN74_ASPWE|nr:uncharacterized protein ASPWEDRAFT_107650 [Aspergillus wentii DTO 134E9]KAI9926006.1 hypothetical protein MW887_004465 [Aspergillus wentii]OJJ36343.1 hypothetical protein ASPWEDRAFT_107650 [Aspergillus wentii DTO 134E9]